MKQVFYEKEFQLHANNQIAENIMKLYCQFSVSFERKK